MQPVSIVAPPEIVDDSPKSPRRRRLVALAVVVAVFAAGAAVALPRDSVRTVSEAELAAELGIEIKLAAVSAGGGLVDFRFKILDAAKAQIIFDELYPSIISSGGAVLTSDLRQHGRTICRTGETQFILFANSGTAVREGETISVEIGDVRIENIAVQG